MFQTPCGAAGSGGKRRWSSWASSTLAGSTWATATRRSVPSPSARSTVAQSAKYGTARDATFCSVLSKSTSTARAALASARNRAVCSLSREGGLGPPPLDGDARRAGQDVHQLAAPLRIGSPAASGSTLANVPRPRPCEDRIERRTSRHRSPCRTASACDTSAHSGSLPRRGPPPARRWTRRRSRTAVRCRADPRSRPRLACDTRQAGRATGLPEQPLAAPRSEQYRGRTARSWTRASMTRTRQSRHVVSGVPSDEQFQLLASGRPGALAPASARSRPG